MKLRDGDLLTSSDAAAVLGLSLEMVTRLRRTGQLPAIRTPSGWCIYLAKDVRALAELRRKAPKMKDGRTKGRPSL
jgi:predicted site-specific integrase-resolvase